MNLTLHPRKRRFREVISFLKFTHKMKEPRFKYRTIDHEGLSMN